MSFSAFFQGLRNDRRGVAAIEFALLAPSIIIMLLGVLMIGIHMQSYNSLRSIAYDVNRYTVVQYQKEIEFDENQIREKALAVASGAPYFLSTGEEERFTVTVTPATTPITGAKRFDLKMSYVPMKIAMPLDLDPPTLTETQAIIVPD